MLHSLSYRVCTFAFFIVMGTVDPARVRLGRIRCLINTVDCMKKGEPLPEPICFVPKELHFEFEGEEPLCVTDEPKDGGPFTVFTVHLWGI